ncbi:fatty acid desaturase [Sphingobacterium litopenaei]|uniref:Fatty acid desaturase n=1 Tax=Sphingobacterium litopenaei TaxID=2763500 RepID=A0ABR7YDX1_9SPHI|nr:fatty acid desaturase [Sphingobacterium litopenaei]MBD1429481.1 fatty acid desaturase [Sphingobacterium litopenaei]
MTHQQKTNIIKKEIIASYKTLKAKYPVLRYQNFIGFSIFISCLLFSAGLGYLWYVDMIPAWALILGNAFLFGVLHELEHDLIHFIYFKNNRIVHNIMLLFVWLVRPLTLNPWFRRVLHYHHHKFSGTPHDVEERGVTNGEKWSLKRLLFTPDLVIGNLLRVVGLFSDIKREVDKGNLKFQTAKKLKLSGVFGLIPFTILSHVILYVFFTDIFLDFLHDKYQLNWVMPDAIKNILTWCNPIIYIVLLPNLLRQFCLHFITSNLHYFGDVEQGNVIEQTQVLTVWWTYPFQLFCFFFGWTHAIHHFVVNETFYIRHIAHKKAHEIMRKHGVRFNDLGTFRRANRYHEI